MSASREVPASLRRRGITQVTDNVPSDCRVRLPAGALFTWFGNPLLDYIRAQAQQPPGETETQQQGDEHGD